MNETNTAQEKKGYFISVRFRGGRGFPLHSGSFFAGFPRGAPLAAQPLVLCAVQAGKLVLFLAYFLPGHAGEPSALHIRHDLINLLMTAGVFAPDPDSSPCLNGTG